MKDKLEMGALVRKLNEATKQYDLGTPIMSDKEWDDLYFKLGKIAIDAAQKIKEALKNKGYEFDVPSPTNQIFIILNQSNS